MTQTADLLLALLRANAVASLLILLVFALRKPVRVQFGARIAYGLWLLPALGAAASLLPARVAEPLIVTAALPASTEQMAIAAATAAAPVVTSSTEATAQIATAISSINWVNVGASAWFAGMVFSITWLALRQLQFMADMRKGRAGPAVVGFIRPKVVVPADFDRRYDTREQEVVLAHEETHLARQDARVVAFAALIRCINWFNPLVHLAVFHLRMDQELACDAQVVSNHPGVRRAYAETMLKAQMAARPLPLGCHWPAGSLHPLTERITLLTASGPSRAKALAGAALVAVLGLGCGVGAWASLPAQPAPVIMAPPAGLSPQDAADAKLAIRYAASRNLPLTFAPVETGQILRSLKTSGVLDDNLDPTGAEVINLPGGKVSVDGEVRDGQVMNIALQDGKAVISPAREGKAINAAPARVDTGKAVDVIAVATAPDGKRIRNHRIVSYDRNGSRGPYDDNGSDYLLGVEATQGGATVNVTVKLWRDHKVVAQGQAVMASGEAKTLTLDNGMPVQLNTTIRDYKPSDEARSPAQREFYAWGSTVAAEMAQATAERARATAQRTSGREARRQAREAQKAAETARTIAAEARRAAIEAARTNRATAAQVEAARAAARNDQQITMAAAEARQSAAARRYRDSLARAAEAGAKARVSMEGFDTRAFDEQMRKVGEAMRTFDEKFDKDFGEKFEKKFGKEFDETFDEKFDKAFNGPGPRRVPWSEWDSPAPPPAAK